MTKRIVVLVMTLLLSASSVAAKCRWKVVLQSGNRPPGVTKTYYPRDTMSNFEVGEDAVCAISEVKRSPPVPNLTPREMVEVTCFYFDKSVPPSTSGKPKLWPGSAKIVAFGLPSGLKAESQSLYLDKLGPPSESSYHLISIACE